MAAVTAAFVALAFGAAGATADTTLTFRSDLRPIQTGYKGLNSVYMGITEFPEATAKGMNSSLRAIEYQRVQDSGLKIARSWYAMDWALPNWPSTAGGYQWTSTKMTAYKNWLGEMQRRNIDVALNMAWTFPQDICSNGERTITQTPDCTPTRADETRWVEWVSDSLDRLINVDGYTNIRYILPFTEPNGDYGGTIPAGYTRSQYYTYIINLLDDQIRADDLSRTDVRPQIKIVGPQESTQILGRGPAVDRWANPLTEYVLANANSDTIDIYSTHRYCDNEPRVGNTECPSYAQWSTTVASWVRDVSPDPLWVDELGAGTGTYIGDNHPFRRTGSYGTYLASSVAAQANAGAKTSILWQFQDQWFQDPGSVLYQHWGVARWLGESTDVHPAYYAFALMGNLLGGRENGVGGSTWVYQTDATTSDVHGLSIGISENVAPCRLRGGCATMMVVNQSRFPQRVETTYPSAGPAPGQTFYRYVFNGNNPPRPTPDKAAYIPRWDKQYTGVTRQIANETIPVNSVVIYSTIDLGGVTTANKAVTATASASSTQAFHSAAYANDGDTSQASEPHVSWKPNSGFVGPQTLDLTWGASQTLDRVEIDLTASNRLTQYTLQHWNGSAWTNFSPAINVTSNRQAHRTHTFTGVSTTRLRLTVPTPTSPPVNEIQVFDDTGTPDTTLGYTATTDNTVTTNNKYDYEKIATTGYTFQAGDRVEYDVKLLANLDNVAHPLLDLPVNKRGIGGIDVNIGSAVCGGSNAFRNAPSGWTDQNGVSGNPGSSIATQAYATWFHRVLSVPACAVGQRSNAWTIVSEQDGRECLGLDPDDVCVQYAGVEATAFYDNIVVKDRTGAVVARIYSDGAPETVQNSLTSNSSGSDVFVTTKTP